MAVDGVTDLYRAGVYFSVVDSQDRYGLVQRYMSGYVAAEVDGPGHALYEFIILRGFRRVNIGDFSPYSTRGDRDGFAALAQVADSGD